MHEELGGKVGGRHYALSYLFSLDPNPPWGPGGKIELDVSFLTEHGRKDGSAHEQEQEQGRGIGSLLEACLYVPWFSR